MFQLIRRVLAFSSLFVFVAIFSSGCDSTSRSTKKAESNLDMASSSSHSDGVTEHAIDDAASTAHWPSWRGPLGNGVALSASPPQYWSEQENVLWKVKLPGLGHSSPVIGEDKIFVTTAIPVGEKFAPIKDQAEGSHDNLAVEQRHQFVVLAYDLETGKELWRKELAETIPHEGGHYTASLASHSPLTDGRHVIASFGSQGLYCLTNEGELLWKKDLGKMQTKHAHGEGSSPALFGNRVVINWDHEAKSFVAAFDLESGNEVWRKHRDEVTSWSSPLIVRVNDQAQVIVAGTDRVRGYDLANGDVIWECGGLSHNIVASPVYADGILIVGSSYELRAMLAIELAKAKGDITRTEAVIWKKDRGTPYVPSPLIYKGFVYYLTHYQGVLSRTNLKTGEEPTGPFRLDRVRDVYASLSAANGAIYVVDRDGITTIVSDTEIPRMISRNQLNDRFSASPAFAGRKLILRGEEHLYCLMEQDEDR